MNIKKINSVLVELKKISDGMHFGEISLGTKKMLRTATIVTQSQCYMAILSRHHYVGILSIFIYFLLIYYIFFFMNY